ncbi:DUF4145 domain-containing protein [Pedobacter alluvionis]|uniref:DUF4145 domain-containing protein n=1 Tax=Pedobacter alluvionis TaxID=475253 RepID=A0A497Y5G8_9SPHI|nr:DUF4145 domain-containing protein [Pedobacter alluvionis]RLJ77347.1 uncharacterized protein DUF4145 [Pedobacter alluvionis]TFB33431.1 DUF4145 domain-containing protein [Pedobacter alluvionis]
MKKKTWTDWQINKPCPACGNGELISIKEKYVQTETRISSIQTTEQPNFPFTDYVFTEHLNCNYCDEIVVASGYKSEDNYPNPDGDHSMEIKYRSFIPAPNIIEIPKSCPVVVKKILIDSFGLFWMDENSCANKIRISVEALMDALKVKKTMITKKGRKEITLHSRILAYQNKRPDVSEFLLAIKWIGNGGSHLSNVTTDQILDAYRLLEYALELIYDDKKKDLTRISRAINKRKKAI